MGILYQNVLFVVSFRIIASFLWKAVSWTECLSFAYSTSRWICIAVPHGFMLRIWCEYFHSIKKSILLCLVVERHHTIFSQLPVPSRLISSVIPIAHLMSSRIRLGFWNMTLIWPWQQIVYWALDSFVRLQWLNFQLSMSSFSSWPVVLYCHYSLHGRFAYFIAGSQLLSRNWPLRFWIWGLIYVIPWIDRR